MSKKKIAVFFPGAGYHSDKPLLYYSKKLCAAHGFEVVEADYGFLSKDDVSKAYNTALKVSRKNFHNLDFNDYDEVLFISKSIGTAVASTIDEEADAGATHIYFTPVQESLEMLHDNAIIFNGTRDRWVNEEDITKLCKEKSIPQFVYQDTGHSLELKDDLFGTIEILEQIMKVIDEFIVSNMK